MSATHTNLATVAGRLSIGLRHACCLVLVVLAAGGCNGGIVSSSTAPPADAGGDVTAVADASSTATPRVLVSGLDEPVVLAADRSSLFFTSGGRLSSVPLDGGEVRTLVASDVAPMLALDDANVYVVLQQTGELSAIPKDGSAHIRMSGNGRVSAVSASRGLVLWAESDDSNFILKSSRSGTPLATYHGCCPGALAATTSTAFACAFALLTVPIAGGSFTELGALRCSWLRADDSAAFTSSPTGIVKVDGNGQVTELAKGLSSAVAALDPSGVYVATLSKILRVPRDGGAPVVVVTSDAEAASSIALSEDAIFFSARGTIWRAPK